MRPNAHFKEYAMIRLQRTPDFEQLLRVLTRDKPPNHLPFYEHLASNGFMSARMGVNMAALDWNTKEAWQVYVDFWLGMGFDGVPIEIPPNLPLKRHECRTDQVSQGSEAFVSIQNMEDFETYPWPDPISAVDLGHYERAAACLPEGAKLVAGVCAGPYEWASTLLGVEGLALALCLDPDLVKAVFQKIGEIHCAALRQIADMDAVGACRQGDDLGFKTATFLSPEHLREYVLPIHAQLAAIAHEAGKPFILHSCGNLDAVYNDIIDGCRIDAKHSFEDVILPVSKFKQQYGTRVTPLGGLDVDFICRAEERDLRRCVRETAEVCFADGFWALGTGNSLTDYMPVEQYMIVLDEGMKITR